MKGIRFLLWVGIGLALLLNSGCASTYMRDRGNDALDIMDIGVVINKDSKPQLGLYIDFFSLTPLGYANVEGTAYGIGQRELGKMDFANQNWGTLLWGSERKVLGQFNPHDPHQARPDQRQLTEPARYDTGIISIAKGDDPPPGLHFVECNRVLYLGWLGLYMTMRPLDIIDFVLGWTTLDILGDDQAHMMN